MDILNRHSRLVTQLLNTARTEPDPGTRATALVEALLGVLAEVGHPQDYAAEISFAAMMAFPEYAKYQKAQVYANNH